MSEAAHFKSFETELNRLGETFGKNLAAYKSAAYDEASLRQEFLNPLFRALGWDIENTAGLIPQHREVEIESRTQIGGRQKRADYLFRTHPTDRFVCEAKKPAEELHAGYAFQAKRYAWNKGLALAVLSDFEEMKIFIVGGRPHKDEPDVGLWKSWHFRQYPLVAQEIWNLLARERVAAGSIDQLIESLPKKPAAKGKKGFIIKPDRARALDTDFLNFLDEARRELAGDLLKHNDRDDLLEGDHLNDAVQRILDRILFLRICEDRDIDTGRPLELLVRQWREEVESRTGVPPVSPKARQQPLAMHEDDRSSRRQEALTSAAKNEPPHVGCYNHSLWRSLVGHFQKLDRRPPSHIPFFNGNLFKHHPSEELVVSDDWLAHFLGEIGDDESPYLFNYIPVEILGTIYERFLGKTVRPQGRGVTIEEKPEVRKAGGVYYTPRYIVEYIVAQTVGKLLRDVVGSAGAPPAAVGAPADGSASTAEGLREGAQANTRGACAPQRKTDVTATLDRALQLRILDPACGSGSFLIRAFEEVCEHCQQWLTDDLRKVLECGGKRSATPLFDADNIPAAAKAPSPLRSAGALQEAAWLKQHRDWCWLEDHAVHLTAKAKRRILRETIHGVDLDPQAVEVTQLSLYLKMLEGENRFTLARERDLFGGDEALLPALEHNIKCGNSLIASDFSMMPEDLVRVHAFDWPVQFSAIMKAGGFDAVIGNPPYIRIQTLQETDPESVEYLNSRYTAAAKGNYDVYVVFVERALSLLNPTGRLGFILPHKFFNAQYGAALRGHLAHGKHLSGIVHFGDQQVFEGATTYTCLLFLSKGASDKFWVTKVTDLEAWQANSAGTAGTLKAADVSAVEWNFNIGKGGALFEKLSKIPTTLDTVAARMGQGIRTSANEVFVLDLVSQNRRTVTAHSEILGREVKLDRGSVLLFLQGREIKPYSLLHSGKIVIMPYRLNESRAQFIPENEFRREFPQTMEYLRENKAYLNARENGRFRGSDWYCYGRVQNIDLMLLPKILVPDIADRASFAFDENGSFAFTSGYGITLRPAVKVSPSFVLGLLNSKLLDFFLKKVSTTMRGGFFRYFTQFIEKLPIVLPDLSKPSDRARHDRLVGLVDKMLALVPKLRVASSDAARSTLQNAVTATDQQIDGLVYDLYGLTAEEIKLVEGAA